MVKGPEVKPEKHGELYDYYAHIEPNERLISAVQRVAGRVYSPHVQFADKAEPAIAERLDEGDRFIIASNHLNIADQFPISATVEQIEVLKPLEGHTFALAKAEYFEKGYLRGSLDATGTIPVFRTQDVGPNLRLQARAARSLIDAATTRLVDGWSMLVFPEGTRNKGDPRRLGRIQGGVGRIAASASQEVGVSILPMALWYGDGEQQHLRDPSIFVGYPLIGPFQSKREVLSLLRPALQESLHAAIELDNTNHKPK